MGERKADDLIDHRKAVRRSYLRQIRVMFWVNVVVLAVNLTLYLMEGSPGLLSIGISLQVALVLSVVVWALHLYQLDK